MYTRSTQKATEGRLQERKEARDTHLPQIKAQPIQKKINHKGQTYNLSLSNTIINFIGWLGE